MSSHDTIGVTEDTPLIALHSSSSQHLQTYTAGEDKSRLALAARELGLLKSRSPRPPVRQSIRRRLRGRLGLLNAGSLSSLGLIRQRLRESRGVLAMLLDSATDDAELIRSVYYEPDDEDESENDRHRLNLSSSAMESKSLGTTTTTTTTKAWKPLESESPQAVESDIGAADLSNETSSSFLSGGSLTAAILGIVKGMVGPAILYLPHAFAKAGYLMAIPLLLLSTILFLYSSNCLLECWRHEQVLSTTPSYEQVSSDDCVDGATDDDDEDSSSNVGGLNRNHRTRRQVLSYHELARRGLGSKGEALVKTGIALMQSGVCLTYLIFVPQNLHTSLQRLLGWNVPPNLCLLVMVLVQIPLSFVRDIRHLTATNLVANVLIVYGLVTCLGLALATTTTSTTVDDRGANSGWTSRMQSLRPIESNWILFVGTSILLFEGSITLLVPLQESVRDVQQRKQFPSVYRRVIVAIITFYIVFGLMNWMAYGANVDVVLTTSLPLNGLSTSVQLAYSLAVLFTFPLQNFPAIEIVSQTLLVHESSSSSISSSILPKSIQKCMSRQFISSMMVLLLSIVAASTMNSLDKVVSLMGSLLGCPIAFVIPPLVHTYVCRPTSRLRVWCNRIVVSMGMVAMIVASSITLLRWNK